ncbi:MAG: dimethyl sulfoxide reductase anchor subunit [Coriobacteriales bacterium]|nr:dimethyl sulfoxide reductase anchor subunit [Coriobacteriales bacterium]
MISEFPLFVFTLLAVMGAGAYFFAAFFPHKDSIKPVVFPLLVLVLLGVSALALMFHLGNPERALYAFTNPTSGITLEGMSSMFFGIMVLVDLILCWRGKPNRIVRIVAAIAGLLLTCAMGYTYTTFMGTPQWASALAYPFFILSAAATGAALAAFFVKDGYGDKRFAIAAFIAIVLGAIALCLEGTLFAGIGRSVAPFIMGAVLVLIGAGIQLTFGKKDASWLAPSVLLLVFAGIAIARYAFYTI